MDASDILNTVKDMFRNADRENDGGVGAEPTYYTDARIRAENKLRSMVGAPVVARKSRR